MTGWKVFAVVNGLLSLSALYTGAFDGPLETAGTLISLPAAAGLLLYAFGRELSPAALWTRFAQLFGAYSLFMIGIFIKGVVGKLGNDGFDPNGLLGAVGAIAFVLAIQYYTWLALVRGSRVAPTTVRMSSNS